MLQITSVVKQTMRILNTRISIILCLLFSISTHVNAAQMPDWLMTSPNDSDQWFYSVGSGKTRSEAQKNALAELANRIQINVQSSTQQFVEAQNKQVDYYLELDNKFDSEQMNFNNVDVIRTHQNKETLYVLAKVDRDSFFDAKVKRLINTLNQLEIKETAPLKQKVAKLISYNWQKQTINNEITLLSAYDIKVNIPTDLQSRIEAKSQYLAKNLNLETHIPNNVSHTIKQQLMSWLTKSGLSVDKKSNGQTLHFIATAPNHWIGKDQFNHVNKIEFEVVVLFEDEIIDKKQFSTQAFAPDPVIAKQQATEQIVRQLTTN